MREDIFWENLLKILNRGSWTFSGDEVKVFSHIYTVIEKKHADAKKPPVVAKPVEQPIKPKRTKKS